MQLTPRYLIAFLLLVSLVQEAHEMAHLAANKLVNGCGGTRYFLYWQLCETGENYKQAITAFAGPFVNFIFMWTGYKLLAKRSTAKEKSIGFTFILATLPLQRLQAFVFRGSDEITGFKKLMSPAEPFKGAAVIAGLLLIALFIGPPMYRAFINIKTKNRWLVMTAFLCIPFLTSMGLQQIAGTAPVRNFLLSVPSQPWLPSWLVLLDIVLLILFVAVARNIGRLFSR